MSDLTAHSISVSVRGEAIVRNASFSARRGEITVLLGPNGAGKSSLLRATLGLLDHTGTTQLNNTPLLSMSRQERARKIAYLPQAQPFAWPNTLRDIVALGRFPHGSNPDRLNHADRQAIWQALTECDLEHLADRPANTLSGGELGRMCCARAFATQADFILADEPVAALDPLHQFRIMELFRRNADRGQGILVVLHDINLAARFADQLIWMKAGEIQATGPVAETLSSATLRSIYEIESIVDGNRVDIVGPSKR